MDKPIQTIRSDRKTIALQIRPDGSLLLKVPLRMTQGEIQDFMERKRNWIEKHVRRVEERQAAMQVLPRLSEEELCALASKAVQVIPERVRYYAPLVGVSYGRITIRNQRSRWGSCSGKGNLNFNCLLMLTPPEVLDSVVVHELCHRKEMNHSERFYAEVLRVFPDYYKWDKWLKENGAAIMGRMTG